MWHDVMWCNVTDEGITVGRGRCGAVWYGITWYVWYVMVCNGMHGKYDTLLWYRVMWCGVVLCGLVWFGVIGMEWHGMAWHGNVCVYVYGYAWIMCLTQHICGLLSDSLSAGRCCSSRVNDHWCTSICARSASNESLVCKVWLLHWAKNQPCIGISISLCPLDSMSQTSRPGENRASVLSVLRNCRFRHSETIDLHHKNAWIFPGKIRWFLHVVL